MNHVTRLFAAAILASAPLVDASETPQRIDLGGALSLALEHNYTIRQARAAHREAAGVVEESRAGTLPSVALSSSYTRLDDRLVGGTGASEDQWQAGLQATQTLYSGGAVGASVRASEAAQQAAYSNLEAAVQAALLVVRERFYAVLLARQQVVVREQAVKLLEEELANATARVDAGSGSPFDKLRAEVALANGQPPLIRARNALRQSAVDLLWAIGLPATEGAEDRIVGELAFGGDELALESMLASAHANRPELKQLEKLVTATEESVTAARAGNRPQVGVFAGYSVEKDQFSDDLDDTTSGWTAGVQASWSIFDGKATRGRVAQARARLQQARLSLDEIRLSIDSEVRQTHSSYREARELVIASQKVVAQAEESVRLARSRFDVGAATQLDVLQAQVALTEARTNEALALHDANVAFARLQRAAALETVPVPASTE